MAENAERSPSLPRLPWYPAAFAGATRDWPLLARGLYRELLDAQWDLGSVPADERSLRSMVRATAAEWRKAWPWVQPKFVLGDDGRLRNSRLELHRKHALELIEKKRRAALERWEGNE
jgi:uncharacterized protein YdaU (DUF1376 family)